ALHFTPNRQFRLVDIKLMAIARRMLVGHMRQARAYDRLTEALFGMVRCLTASIDAKDPSTCGHSERVARMAVRLGKEMHMPETVVSDLYLSGLLHDVGKIGIHDSILQKADSLTEE